MKRQDRLTGSFYRWLPAAAMLAVALTDHVTWQNTSLLPLFAVGPALAAGAGPRRRVASATAAAIVLCVVTAASHSRLESTRFAVALTAVVVVAIASWYVATLRLRTEKELTDVRAVADTVQQVLLGPVPARTGSGRLAVSYTSAAEAARIGGDLYEAVPLPGGSVRIIVADVQGKGLPAVRTTAVVLAAFREAAPYAERLDEVGRRIERALARRTESDRFVTAVLAEIAEDGSVDLLNYGHPAPLVRRADGLLESVEPQCPGPPLGLGSLTDAGPGRDLITLAPGDRILFHTDGLTEARDPSGEFYPVLARAGAPLSEPDPDEALARLREDVARHTRAPLTDDSAFLLFQHTSPLGAALPPADPHADRAT
ncbi:PP2C family protein-serine/threonine phosphatase [Kitasatospora sp. NBC_00315]|uniref:PP2C family protein-serine/threonine phosphatase n=1 Tax=Kitasatospora sp. NBC_00315 TaxID=2975963 RepID=UPI003249136C